MVECDEKPILSRLNTYKFLLVGFALLSLIQHRHPFSSNKQ